MAVRSAVLVSCEFLGALVLCSGEEKRVVNTGGQHLPLENELSATFAYALSNPAIWRTELAWFFQGGLFETLPTQLFALEPYRPGSIPVVLIHGTASSVGRWADVINDLPNDPAIGEHFHFWLVTHNTGNPIPLSAFQLRAGLRAAVHKLDPDRRDPALHQMLLIGHSQGGLLSKLLVINSGSRLCDAFGSKPTDELTLTNETRETPRPALFVTPVPDVTRGIFIATPHRGSFVTGRSRAQLIGWLVTLPLRVRRLVAETLIGDRDAILPDPKNIRIGSLYGMAPGSPFGTTVSSIPVVPTVKANSIIAVQGNGPITIGDDGVVNYGSVHIDEAESEVVIRSGRSVQSNPRAVAEVRRILLLQRQFACPLGCSAISAVAGVTEPIPARVPSRHVALAQP
jgi:hypothetical protein